MAPRQELGQRLRDQGGDRAPRLPGPLPHPGHQRGRQPHGEHRRGLGDRRRPVVGGTLDIPARLPRRAAEPLRQHPRGLATGTPDASNSAAALTRRGVLPSIEHDHQT